MRAPSCSADVAIRVIFTNASPAPFQPRAEGTAKIMEAPEAIQRLLKS